MERAVDERDRRAAPESLSRKAELLRQQQSIEKQLAEIEREEKRRATEEIKRIAEAAGLTVTICEKGKKRRGRPPGSKRPSEPNGS